MSKIELVRCHNPCQGLSCCNCCGEAPHLRPKGCVTQYDTYDRECCYHTRYSKPEECMGIQGKLRCQWMKEMEK